MLAFLIVALGLILAISIFSNWVFYKTVKLTMNFVVNEGSSPYYDEYIEKYGSEAPYTIKYFKVTYNKNTKEVKLKSNSMKSIDYETISKLTKQIVSGRNRGWINEYRYQIYNDEVEDNIVFINFEREIRSKDTVMRLTFLAFLSVYSMVFFVMIKISKKAVQPIEDGIRKQKEFISDASHEIKTPLAIISANTDVLELQYGENDWINSNRNQVRRLTKLINQMLTLTKYESDEVISLCNVDIKEIVENALLDYKLLFENEGIEVETELRELYSYTNEDLVYQIISILFDNAIKYTDEKKKFKVSIVNREVRLENTSEYIDDESLHYIFDRFYRVEKSRSREKGGNGIGLSLAKTLSEAIEVDLSVEMVGEDIIRFTIKFNN